MLDEVDVEVEAGKLTDKTAMHIAEALPAELQRFVPKNLGRTGKRKRARPEVDNCES